MFGVYQYHHYFPILLKKKKGIRKGQEIHKGLKMNVTNQHLIYTNDVNLLDKNISNIKQNMEAFWLLVKTVV